MKYIAHRREADNAEEPLCQHLKETADLAGEFASVLGVREWGEYLGLAHDIGKYSQEFQKRIRGGGNSVDHSTAGAQEIKLYLCKYCIAGHHGGLPNGGSSVDTCDESTLQGRLKRKVPNYEAYKSEIELKCPSSVPKITPLKPRQGKSRQGFTMSFFIRMLYSCLVDADFLCTERFMENGMVERGGFDSLAQLAKKLDAYLEGLVKVEQSQINQKRNEILQSCISAAEADRGLFSLTVPTGGGKTISSLAFALKHALKHGMRRVIYVIPYTSIIEQNAKVFRGIVGSNNVIEHHANFDVDDDEFNAQRFATENWDAPLIVTTNVQFFESLFANKSSRCRKLHNIVNSVIIFDEVQMLPFPYLIPCVSAIDELVKNYGCSAVLCSATQPALNRYFEAPEKIREICPNPEELCKHFERGTYRHIGKISDEDLAAKLNEHSQVLCIVNSRKQAQILCEMLNPGERFHLSTLMTARHRQVVLWEIRKRLRKGLPCKVVSTSLIEAGVDVDFPVVYRSEAGLDSIVQSAGRCNREMKRNRDSSFVYVFEPATEYKFPVSIEQSISVGRDIIRDQDQADYGRIDIVKEYFKTLFYIKGDEQLDSKKIMNELENNSIPFEKIADKFHLISDNTVQVLIPLGRRLREATQGRPFYPTRKLMRLVGRSSVNVYEQQLHALDEAGLIDKIGDNLFLLLQSDDSHYSHEFGLVISPEKGATIL
ncbi:CRISPR-associated helicase Cas3' [Candidatus Sumerlaeota bacterium]|nr:CRISPR-associated helicase Cas3' [Candidatus Sumerlaeota bacterium]